MGKFFTSLRSRLILLIILTSIPGIFLLLQKGLEQRNRAMRAAGEEVQHLGQIASNTDEVMVEMVKGFLLTVAHTPSIQAKNMDDCKGIFTHLFNEHYNYFSSFYIADLNKNILCTPPESADTPDFEGCDHYKNITQANDFVISGYHICKMTGKSVISIGYPVSDNLGNRVLAANVSLDLEWFFDFARDAKLPDGSELILVNEKGMILSHYPDNKLWRGKKLPETTVINQLMTRKEGVMTGPGLDGRNTVYAISSMRDTMSGLYVVIGQPTSIAFAEANQTLLRDMGILLLVLTAMIGLSWYLGDVLIVKQAQTLVSATSRLAEGDFSIKSGVDYSHGELGQLAQSFDHMAQELARREAERNQNEADLTEYARNLEHSNQELRDFTNVAAHDLQEPLRKIQTFGEMLQERYAPNLDDRANDYLHRMRESANRMQALITDLRSYASVNAKTTVRAQVNLNETLQQILKDLDMQIEMSHAQISVSALPIIEADPAQMGHLFLNLLTNAIKFRPPDQSPVVTISAARMQPGKDGSTYWDISVSDQGIGLDEKFSDRIFQPFQRLNAQGEYEGTGMGLAICRKIVDRHGGSITVRSTLGKGATFIIRLPEKQRPER